MGDLIELTLELIHIKYDYLQTTKGIKYNSIKENEKLVNRRMQAADSLYDSMRTYLIIEDYKDNKKIKR